MLRARLNDELKLAMKAKHQRATATLRLILAALKDRDIAARSKANTEGIDEAEIIEMMQKMVRQRHESIELYRKGNRPDLVEQETEEIAIIERFLPQQLAEADVTAAVEQAIAESGAAGVKDMGRVMAALKARYAGRMDFARAGAMVRQRLGS